MRELSLKLCTVPELRAAADAGRALYCCERVEDPFGRLLVGIGARLMDRELDAARRAGRTTLAASRVALEDGPLLRAALSQVSAGQPVPSIHESPAAVKDALNQLRSICPLTAAAAASARPQASDLLHGLQTGRAAVALMAACNRMRESGTYSSLLPCPAKLRQEALVAGVVHDIGKWDDGSPREHARLGAEILRRTMPGTNKLETKARMILRHHDCVALLQAHVGDAWERHRCLPLAVAEAIVESNAYGQTIENLANVDATSLGRGMLVAACEVFEVVPRRAIVQRSVEGKATELAVCLRERPRLLLRFARRRGDGDYDPLIQFGQVTNEAEAFVSGECEGEALRVASILGDEEYDRRFGRIERLAALRTAPRHFDSLRSLSAGPARCDGLK